MSKDLDLKKIGEIIGLPIYVELSKIRWGDHKSHKLLMIQNILKGLFNDEDVVTELDARIDGVYMAIGTLEFEGINLNKEQLDSLKGLIDQWKVTGGTVYRSES